MEIPKPPTPFCYNPKKVRAIVLGADPSNFSDKGKRKIHRHHIYKIKLQKVFKYYVLIYNRFEEILEDGKKETEV